MARNNYYKSYGESNNQNKYNNYSSPYDDNYYDNRPLIEDDDDDFEDELEDDDISDETSNDQETAMPDGAPEEGQAEPSGEASEREKSLNPVTNIKNKYEDARQKYEDSKEKIHKTAEDIKNAPQNIKNKANEVATNIKNTPENVRNKLNEAKTNIKNTPQNIKNNIKNAPENIKKGAIAKVDKAKESVKKKVAAKKEEVKKKIQKIKLSVKILGVVGSILLGFAALMIPVLLIAALYESLFGLTGGKSNRVNITRTAYTQAEIEKSLLYVGDSRTVGMESALNNSNIKYIAEVGKGYNWLLTKQVEIKQTIEENKIKFVVFALGVNDLYSIDSYINLYNTYLADTNVHYLFLSVNPVDDAKAKSYGYTVTNADIKTFNDKLSSVMAENYIDTYSEIKGQILTDDGLHYRASTYIDIHRRVISFIQANFKRVGNFTLLEEYPNGEEDTQLLLTPITELLGDDGIVELENAINNAIIENGKCSKQAAAAAGVTLAYNLYQMGYRIPYYWGGEHTNTHYTVNKLWGKKTSVSCSPTQCYYYYGFDCSGFTSWAYSIATGSEILGGTSNFINWGEEISFSEAETGDILVSDNHVIMVIENKGDYLVTLESTGTYNGINHGLIFGTKTESQLVNHNPRYYVRNIQSFLDRYCNA